SCVV
ncbi:superoxide dismutase, partial [Vibrio cholerae HC-17A2]